MDRNRIKEAHENTRRGNEKLEIFIREHFGLAVKIWIREPGKEALAIQQLSWGQTLKRRLGEVIDGCEVLHERGVQFQLDVRETDSRLVETLQEMAKEKIGREIKVSKPETMRSHKPAEHATGQKPRGIFSGLKKLKERLRRRKPR